MTDRPIAISQSFAVWLAAAEALSAQAMNGSDARLWRAAEAIFRETGFPTSANAAAKSAERLERRDRYRRGYLE